MILRQLTLVSWYAIFMFICILVNCQLKINESRKSVDPDFSGMSEFLLYTVAIYSKNNCFLPKKTKFPIFSFITLNGLKGICVVYTTQIPLRTLRLLKTENKKFSFFREKAIIFTLIPNPFWITNP